MEAISLIHPSSIIMYVTGGIGIATLVYQGIKQYGERANMLDGGAERRYMYVTWTVLILALIMLVAWIIICVVHSGPDLYTYAMMFMMFFMFVMVRGIQGALFPFKGGMKLSSA